MGNRNSTKNVVRNEVDDEMDKRQKEMDKEFKILLLGAGESGKSTIFKQVRILRSKGYDNQELQRLKYNIYSYVTVNMGRLANAAYNNGFEVGPEKEDRAQKIRLIDDLVAFGMDFQDFPFSLGRDITALWKDPGIKKAFDIRAQFHMDDGFEYFMKQLPRLLDPKYTPTIEDILNLRQKTIGIVELQFEYMEHTFKFLDVAGQRTERKKWLNQFESISAVVYVVSLSDYNQTLMEDNKTNRMEEALTLFETTLSNPAFKNAPVVLFFNKKDLFERKLKKFPLSDYFPAYDGGNDLNLACNFVKQMFVSKLKNLKKSNIHTHFTCATDVNQAQMILKKVEDIVFGRRMSNAAML